MGGLVPAPARGPGNSVIKLLHSTRQREHQLRIEALAFLPKYMPTHLMIAVADQVCWAKLRQPVVEPQAQAGLLLLLPYLDQGHLDANNLGQHGMVESCRTECTRTASAVARLRCIPAALS